MAKDNTFGLIKANIKGGGHIMRLRKLKILKNPNKLCI
jgi:hypothetical protein